VIILYLLSGYLIALLRVVNFRSLHALRWRVQFQGKARRFFPLLDPEIKNYAGSLYDKSVMESVKQLRQEKSEYLARHATIPSVALLSGPEIQAIVQQHVRHIERCMRAILESYQTAFADANKTPSDDDFRKILEEAQAACEQQIKNSSAAVHNFVVSRGGSGFPPGLMESALSQIRTSSGHGHDQVLREWKIWRDKTRLLRSQKVEARHTSAPVSDKGERMRSAFISYSWDDEPHRDWVRRLAERLRADGVDVSIDRWGTAPGDQLPAYMEKAIRDNQFVVIVCTPRYKRRSDAREGGVGYEGDIMTAEVMTSQNNRKFIPVLRSGKWTEAAPSWLAGKYHIDLTGDPYSERQYEDLVRTLLEIRETPPPIGKPMATLVRDASRGSDPRYGSTNSEFEDIKITRVIVEDITAPRNDGTHGNALYSIPFALSRRPPTEWAKMFGGNWSHPPQFTTMHRPGIASVQGATITLNGTTIEEVESYHRDTLQLAVAETNKEYREWQGEQERRRTRETTLREEHQKRIEDTSKRIKFD
jgi:hypothetical protein